MLNERVPCATGLKPLFLIISDNQSRFYYTACKFVVTFKSLLFKCLKGILKYISNNWDDQAYNKIQSRLFKTLNNWCLYLAFDP